MFLNTKKITRIAQITYLCYQFFLKQRQLKQHIWKLPWLDIFSPEVPFHNSLSGQDSTFIRQSMTWRILAIGTGTVTDTWKEEYKCSYFNFSCTQTMLSANSPCRIFVAQSYTSETCSWMPSSGKHINWSLCHYRLHIGKLCGFADNR